MTELPPEEGFLLRHIVALRAELRERLRERWMQQAQKPSDLRSLKRLASLYFIVSSIEQ